MLDENRSPTPEKSESSVPSLSAILREAMERQHISNNRLAKAAGVSEGTIVICSKTTPMRMPPGRKPGC